MTFPKFNQFAITATEADVAASKVKKQFDGLTPGDHELEVLAIKPPTPTQSNPDWFRFQIQIGKPGSTLNDKGNYKGAIFHSVMVPTKDLSFNGKNGPTFFPFTMLSDFLIGFGIELNTTNAASVIPEVFAENNPLVGRKLKVKLGYKNNFIDYRAGKYVLCDKNGQPLITSAPNEFANRESAEGQSITDNFELSKFMEVLSVYPGEKPAATPAKKKRASADW